jgi:hypothetical protein
MESAVQSERILLKAISEGKITCFDEAIKLVDDKDLWFGPESGLAEVLVLNESLGIIRWDKKTNKIWKRPERQLGRWYLVFTEYYKSVHSHGERQKGILLDVDNQEEAIDKAKDLWNKELKDGTYEGDNGALYPQDPRVIYEFGLK